MNINKESVKAIIFDFDGVIHDSFKFHQVKIHDFSGISLTDEEYKSLHDGNFFENTDNKVKNISWNNYRDFVYDDMISLEIDHTIKDELIKLSNKFDLYIVSSGGKNNIKGYLEKNGVLNCFKKILGMESNTTKVDKFKTLFNYYDLTSENSIFITDTLGDILEANLVNLKSIGVDYGFHDRERLLKGNPIAIISSFEEISRMLS